MSTSRMEDSVYAHPQLIPQQQAAGSSSSTVMGALNDFECGGGEASAAWLQQANVAKALHVGHPNMGQQSYTKDRDLDLRPLYKASKATSSSRYTLSRIAPTLRSTR